MRCLKSRAEDKKKKFTGRRTTSFPKSHSRHRLPTAAQCRVERMPASHNTGIYHQKLDSGNVFFRPKERVWYFTFCKVPKGGCSPRTLPCNVLKALGLVGLLAFRGRWRELGADRTAPSMRLAGPLARLSGILREGDEPRACSSTARLSLPLSRETGDTWGVTAALSFFLFSFFQNTDLRRVRVPCENLPVSESLPSLLALTLAKGFRQVSALFLDNAIAREGSLGEDALLLLPAWPLPFQFVVLRPSGQARFSLSIEGMTVRGRSNCLGSLISCLAFSLSFLAGFRPSEIPGTAHWLGWSTGQGTPASTLSLVLPLSSLLAERVAFDLSTTDFSSPPAAPVNSGTMDWLVDRGLRLDSKYSTNSTDATSGFSLCPKDHRRGMVLKAPGLARDGMGAFMLMLRPLTPRTKGVDSSPPFS